MDRRHICVSTINIFSVQISAGMSWICCRMWNEKIRNTLSYSKLACHVLMLWSPPATFGVDRAKWNPLKFLGNSSSQALIMCVFLFPSFNLSSQFLFVFGLRNNCGSQKMIIWPWRKCDGDLYRDAKRWEMLLLTQVQFFTPLRKHSAILGFSVSLCGHWFSFLFGVGHHLKEEPFASSSPNWSSKACFFCVHFLSISSLSILNADNESSTWQIWLQIRMEFCSET